MTNKKINLYESLLLLLTQSWMGKLVSVGSLVLVVTVAYTLISVIPEGIAATGKAPDKQAAKRGKELYNVYCQSCHGKNGVGESPIPPAIRDPSYFIAPALNESQHAWHHTDENLLETILKGSTRTKRMAAWERVISKQNAEDLVAYMKSLWSPRILACQGPKHMSCM